MHGTIVTMSRMVNRVLQVAAVLELMGMETKEYPGEIVVEVATR